MNVYKLFPTTVMEFDFKNHSDVQILLKLIENKEHKTNHGLVKKGVSSFTSNEVSILNEPSLFKLRSDIQVCINNYSNYLGLRPSRLGYNWFNILFKGGKVDSHHHGSSIISGAYYPHYIENTCNLIFKSPLYSAVNYEDVKPNSNFYTKFSMPIKQGYLYLFPGWLEHYTEENTAQEKRIVISFNTEY
jgi:uncharacterized protein (TIGR02466 family)